MKIFRRPKKFKVGALAAGLFLVSLLILPGIAAADNIIQQLQTPFYDPNSTDCTAGFLGTGPIYGPKFPSLDVASLKTGITNYINNIHPESPLLGQVDYIISQGQASNYNPAMVVAMAQKETQLGTVGNGTPTGGYNITNIRGGGSSFARYSGYPGGIKATYDNLSTNTYSSFSSVAEIVNTWAPPSENDTTGYIKFMGDNMAMILGGAPDASAASNVDTCSVGQLSGNGQVDNSDEATLANKILQYGASGAYHCDNPGDCSDIEAMANGNSLKGVGNCQVDQLNPKILQLLVYLLDNGFKIGTFAICSDHSDDGIGGHVGGNAVDISTINGTAVATNTPDAKTQTLKLDQFLNSLPGQLAPDQLISYGYGEQPDPDLQALQLFGGKPCATTTPSCLDRYTLPVEQQHENHVHVGY